MMFAQAQFCFPCNTFNTLNVIKSDSNQRSRFTKEEDELLKRLVSSQSQPKWSEISKYFHNRTARQCRERYNNYLRPNLINGPWTKEEDDLLIKLYEMHGPKWSLISQSFNSRSQVNVKNRHSCLINHSNAKVIKSPVVNMQENTEINTNTTQITTEKPINEILVQEEPEEPINDDCFENLFSNFEIVDDMWSTTPSTLPEDDLFAF